MRHTPFLKDLGSGNGFMLPAQVFYYSGRRSFLYTETDHSKLDPPVDFMSKAQVRRLQRLADSKGRIASSRKVRAIRWVHVEDIGTSTSTSGSTRPATAGDAYPRANKIHNTEKSGYGLLLRSVPASKASRTSMMRMDVSRSLGSGSGTEAEGEDGGFVATEWEPQFEAGVHFWLNTETGECRETLPPVRPKAQQQPQQPQQPSPQTRLDGRRGSSMRPVTAPACMEGPLLVSFIAEDRAASMGSSSRLKQLRDELAMGTGAKVYDASELKQLLEYLESSDTPARPQLRSGAVVKARA